MGGITRKNKASGNGPPTVGAVSFETQQVLTPEQKIRAQENIEAVGFSEFNSLLDSLGDVKRDIRAVYISARQLI